MKAGAPLVSKRVLRRPANPRKRPRVPGRRRRGPTPRDIRSRKRTKSKRRSLRSGRGALRALLTPSGPEAREARRLPELRAPRRVEFHAQRTTTSPFWGRPLARYGRRGRPRRGPLPRIRGRPGMGALARRQTGTGIRVRAGIPRAGGPPATAVGGVRTGTAVTSSGIPGGGAPRAVGMPTPLGRALRARGRPTLPGRVLPLRSSPAPLGRPPQVGGRPVLRKSRTSRPSRPKAPGSRPRHPVGAFWKGLGASSIASRCRWKRHRGQPFSRPHAATFACVRSAPLGSVGALFATRALPSATVCYGAH